MDHILEEYDIIPNRDDIHILNEQHHHHVHISRKHHHSSETDILAYNDAIKKIISSPNFNSRHFADHELMLCESYCLLWQNSNGKLQSPIEKNEELNQGVSTAMLLDLYTSKIIDFMSCGNSLVIDIVNPDLALNPIQAFILNILLRRRPRRKTIQDVLAISKTCGCAKIVLKNLRLRGIIGVSESGRLFAASARRQSTIRFGPIRKIEQQLKWVALKEKCPDSYMLSLITLCFIGQERHTILDPILERQLTKREYKAAKENLKITVKTQATILKSAKFVKKKFSRDAHTERLCMRKESFNGHFDERIG
ncbi:uncharacterized protein [Clytia hemisphaerica]